MSDLSIMVPLRSLNSGFPTPPAFSLREAYVLSRVLDRITAPPYIPIASGI